VVPKEIADRDLELLAHVGKANLRPFSEGSKGGEIVGTMIAEGRRNEGLRKEKRLLRVKSRRADFSSFAKQPRTSQRVPSSFFHR